MIGSIGELDPKESLAADVCIVGAGAAGITLARELIGRRLRVVVLESGGLDYDQEVQDLGRGETGGHPYQPLEQTRIRGFGGTTNLWNGACGPLERLDFEPRGWVPMSGWPIRFDDLRSYYERAKTVCEIGGGGFGDGVWRELGLEPPAFDPERLRTRFWRYSPPTRFGTRYRRDLETASEVRVLLRASVTALVPDEGGRRLQSLTIESLDGARAELRARVFVLAAGGIENARLLLASADPARGGLANSNDRVGRTFMEHTYYQAGHLAAADSEDARRRFDHIRRGSLHVLAGFRLSEELQEREQVLDSATLLDPAWRIDNAGVLAARIMMRALREGTWPNEAGRRTLQVLGDLDDVLLAAWGRVAHGDSARYQEPGIAIFAQSEQAPDLESRVRLADETDPFGRARARLDWRVSDLDRRTVEVSTRTVAAEFARLGLGRIRLADWMLEGGDAWRDGLHWGHHHMGTTRMSSDPSAGVVDSDCRLHELSNVYVAGSSVFPTGGYMNPTLTIVALAIRLADHLARSLG